MRCRVENSYVCAYVPKGKDKDISKISSFMPCNMPAHESHIPKDALNTYLATESLKQTVNGELLEKGVFLSDIMSIHISPLAEIESGAYISSNCQIYGNTKIKSGANRGPNSSICHSGITETAQINSPQ